MAGTVTISVIRSRASTVGIAGRSNAGMITEVPPTYAAAINWELQPVT